ncbi:MAG TPA: Na+/H+ antiporter NhaA [Vicinamibacterales bacterium]|nr:Na+/H+ antiporter NhaA [Vicinamibacterales bacterium]
MKYWRLVIDNSLLLVIGAVGALVWANLDLESYEQYAHAIHFAVNDIGMVFFFALAAKEVFEATLPGGALASPRKAATPVLAAIGGMIAPAAIYIGIVSFTGHPELSRGWAIPCATDIAFSYLAIVAVFNRTHPAVPFLLLLAIADDAMGLVILAVFYPSGELSPGSLVMYLLPAMAFAELMRRRKIETYWAYLACGALAWTGLYMGGLHPALALVPIVPLMPHARRDLGIFDDREPARPDTLSQFEHAFRVPVQFVLFFFGFANAGVPLSAVAPVTWAVLIALVVGKPAGIVLFTWFGQLLGFERAPALNYRVITVLGIAAGIGFTVALFFTTAAFQPGAVLNAAKMGALLSFAALPLTILIARVLRVADAPATSARSRR